ncbi:MAG: hypothetical protein COA78_19845 [Blastopirellula sp.]|nr:MAG: hypothetical protein COA78_19845 [Blastopirellula sp.]
MDKMNQAEFDKYIAQLRSDDSMTYEDGFHSLDTRVDEVLVQLIELEEKETEEDFKSKLVELIGCSIQPEAIELLKKRLSSPFYEVRIWAYSSLCHSESKEGNQIAEEYKVKNPDEEFL